MSRPLLFVVMFVLVGLQPAAAQGVGRPPLFDPAPGDIRNTLQFEGAISFDDDAPWHGSTGLRFRRDWTRYALSAGAALLAADDPGYAFALAAQYKPGMHVLLGEAEKALWITGGPIIDVARQASDPFGRQYSVTGSLAVVLMLGIPGLTVEFSAAPHYTLRNTSFSDLSSDDRGWGVQSGVVAGVARFVQLMVALDWSDRGARPPAPFEDAGAWTLGIGLRTRLPGT